MFGKTVGIIGTGNIGSITAKILQGFGCKIIAVDLVENKQLVETGVTYVDLITLCKNSDIISIHTSLNEKTKYLINKQNIALMKKGVMLINTSRGAVINTEDVIEGLKAEVIGALGIDVYEKEKGLFFFDHSNEVMKDDVFARLLTFKNVLITSHQAFLTQEALHNLAYTTIYNINCAATNTVCENEL
jgi:D-lactate dehydrogenase